MSNLKNFNPKNERVKNKYFKYLLTAKQKNIKSVDSVRKALMKFEEFSHFADFTAFNPDVAIAFKEYLLMQTSKQTGLYKIDLPDGDYLVRKLDPVECERLQGFPDDYTNVVSNTQRYKSLGNSFTVPVIEHILKQIF